jgi:peptide subunit release factor 1 (eRF1)
MKLSGRSDIEALTRFKGNGDLVASFYLDTDKSRMTRKEIQLSLKNLLAAASTQMEGMDAGKEKKESLGRDLDLISDFCSRSLGTLSAPGLAAFSCARRNFWHALELPHGPRNRVIFDTTFYVRPLSAILERYSRICILLLGRREAKWYEVAMGEIRALESLTSNVPGKVKEGGYEGTESKRIERHLEARVHDHFKKAAQMTFDLFRKHGFDWLFLGYEDNHHADFEAQLHSYLREKIGGRLKSRVGDSATRILAEALEIETRLKKDEETETVQRLIAELERGGLACSGLRETLRRLNQFETQTLVVTHNFSKPGRICPSHKFLYVDELKCPVCQKKTDVLPDVIDEAIETSLKRNCAVKHITPPSKLDRYGHIGAFLKYKV